MTKAQCLEKSAQICKKLELTKAFQEAKNILVYSSIRNEVDLSELIETAWSQGKSVYFPKTYQDEIIFYRVNSFSDLKEGRFHVLEPDESAKQYRDEKALIIVPGLAFSKGHQRIGFGKGYYDRFLKNRQDILHSIGIGYDFQFIEDFQANAFDIPLNQLFSNLGEEHILWN